MKISLNKSLPLALVIIFTTGAQSPVFANSLFHQQLAKIESKTDGKIGIYAINTSNNTRLEYRAQEHFPMGCTSKVMGVAAVLKKSMQDKNLLAKNVNYTQKDLSSWHPITGEHIKDGMTVKELCAAAISYSDNTAMNLLVRQLGGLEQINVFARSIHNKEFRQDNGWPEESYSGGKDDLSDSSTPEAMASSLNQLTLGKALAQPQKELLLSWLKANTTGENRIRAGVPKGWIVGDKTGTGTYYGTTNDLAIIWPPRCKPIILAVYFTSDNKTAVKREDIVVKSTQLVIAELAKSDKCLS